ncbi:MAG: NAD(+) diphosphatase [Micrococcales bacterium]|nr:NAD(+) diphosphatase [Micrococcales bacterium]
MPSQPAFPDRLVLARAELDRDHLARAGGLARLRAEAGARIVVLHEGRMLLAGERRIALLPAAEVPLADLELFLGRTTAAAEDAASGAPVIAAVVEDAAAQLLGRSRTWGGLRELGALLPARDAGIFTEAVALANWHASSGFSPRTGRPTEPGLSGWVRTEADPATGASAEFYPRTDAAIIVGVVDADDRLLLGSNALWPAGRFSLLAGFVEPGESLEAAVEREVFEESGIRVADPRYLGSQPWPFPASLMVGFTARVAEGASTRTRPDGDEIRELQWFTREELTAAVAAGRLRLPGETSIARAIIAEWHGGDLGPSTW